MSGRKPAIFRKPEKHMRKNFGRKLLKYRKERRASINGIAQKEADMEENNNMTNTNNVTNTAGTANTGHIDIKVTVTPMQDQEGCIKANASIVFNGIFKVTGIRIGISRKGNIFVSMPDYKTGRLDDNGNDIYQDIAYPVTRQFRKELYNKIVEEYKAVIGQKKSILEKIKSCE